MDDNRHDFSSEDALILYPHSTDRLRSIFLLMTLLAVILGGMLAGL